MILLLYVSDIELQHVKDIEGTLYRCEVAIVDTGFIPPQASGLNNSVRIGSYSIVLLRYVQVDERTYTCKL